MPKFNEINCYKMPAIEHEVTPEDIAKLPSNWLEELVNHITTAEEYRDKRDVVLRYYNNQISSRLAYGETSAVKKIICDLLQRIYIFVNQPIYSSEVKQHVFASLPKEEQELLCQAGFHERLHGIYQIIIASARDVNSITALYRREIVDNTARMHTSYVHDLNKFFTLAGCYGVQPINLTLDYSSIAEDTVISSLHNSFTNNYTLFHILNYIKQYIKNKVIELGYHGHAQSYASGEYENFLQFISLFCPELAKEPLSGTGLFIIENECIVDINWPIVILQLITNLEEMNYFTLSHDEQSALNTLKATIEGSIIIADKALSTKETQNIAQCAMLFSNEDCDLIPFYNFISECFSQTQIATIIAECENDIDTKEKLLNFLLLPLPAELKLSKIEEATKDGRLAIVIKTPEILVSVIKQFVTDEHKLQLLNLLGKDMLGEIITDDKSMTKILNYLSSNPHKLQFINSFGAHKLLKIFNSEKVFSETLEELQEDNYKLELLNLFGPYRLRVIINDTTSFLNVLKTLSEDVYRSRFINLLGLKKIVSLINNANTLCKILLVLPEEMQSHFLNLIGAEKLRNIINDDIELSVIVDCLYKKGSKLQLLQLLDAEKLSNLINKEGLRIILFHLPNSVQIALLNLLPVDKLRQIIQDEKNLALTLDRLPVYDCKKQLFNLLGPNALRAIITDITQLSVFVLDRLPEDDKKLHLLNFLGTEKLQAIIKNCDALCCFVLDTLSDDAYKLQVLNLLGKEHLQTIIKNNAQLDKIIATLTSEEAKLELYTLLERERPQARLACVA